MSVKISTGEGSIPLGENASGQVSICFFFFFCVRAAGKFKRFP